jgi:murein L,D-transpeptidase YafK
MALQRRSDWSSDVCSSDLGRSPLTLVLTHRICALSGTLGPKRREGDLQIPEGYYHITQLNPTSNFYLSMLIDYPNASDRVRARAVNARAPLGGAIMVHGSCVTIGCIPIEDEPVEQIYLTVAEVLGRAKVPIHVFPRRLPDSAALAALQATTSDPATQALWAELAAGWQRFEQTHHVPRVRVGEDGAYVVEAAPGSAAGVAPAAARVPAVPQTR